MAHQPHSLMYLGRSEEIFENYLAALDRALQNLLDGKITRMPELQDIAGGAVYSPYAHEQRD